MFTSKESTSGSLSGVLFCYNLFSSYHYNYCYCLEKLGNTKNPEVNFPKKEKIFEKILRTSCLGEKFFVILHDFANLWTDERVGRGAEHIKIRYTINKKL